MQQPNVVRRKSSRRQSEAREAFKRQHTTAVQSLTQEEIEDFRQVFTLFDKDRSGTIDVKELNTAMHSLGMKPTEAEVASMIAEVDVDGSGEIDFEEFLALMARRSVDTDLEENLRHIFNLYDTNSDGFISREELKRGLIQYGKVQIGDEEVDDILIESANDEDGDGKISFDEFIEFMVIES
eukprot:NODE_4723_length_771_cov_40.364266_g4379_i0.p1 GENE.NODE_4723_length_771_cov_40.364266_g4379_i0~~NODE_4723_length_771_cov_40.364266_g4379_i0.p1  ORF type:complete len:210 (+),score=73.42 NODE_4723_length_771_cov_40.364266_g4379_i0:87-632(+)